MKRQNIIPSYSRFYDQVLSEITSGEVDQGINFLVGMLDAASLQKGSFDQARAELRRHLLHHLLLEDPLCAHAAAKPGDSEGLAAIINGKSKRTEISPTGVKLFAATRGQPIARALLSRQASTQRLVARALEGGIAVLDLAGAGRACDGPYELICATRLADRLNGRALTAELAKLRAILSNTGRITLSATLPNHLGSGWRSACLHWNPYTYDELRLTQIAAGAGFTARIYRDEADCLVWAELRPAQRSQQGEGASHGH